MAEQQVKQRDMRAFYEVKAPLTSTKISLYGASPDALVGKVVKLDLTRNLRGKNLELSLKVRKSTDGLEGDPIALNLFGSYIRRMMRKGADYVEDSFIGQCKDGAVLVKPFLITRKKVSRAVRQELRKTTQEHLLSLLTIRTNLEMFSDIIAGKTQKELSLKLKKIYPLALCEIRVFELVPGKK